MLRSVICSTSAVLILVAVAVADEKAASNSESTRQTGGKAEGETGTSSKPAEESKQVITGSYIPHKVKRNGAIAKTTSPVYVIDRKMIDQTGATTVSQVLKRQVTSIR